jgi:hypothetical protein
MRPGKGEKPKKETDKGRKRVNDRRRESVLKESEVEYERESERAEAIERARDRKENKEE